MNPKCPVRVNIDTWAGQLRPRNLSGGGLGVILVHNHPSGDPTPSVEDIRITRQLIDVGNILSIRVLDHNIIVRSLPAACGQPDRLDRWLGFFLGQQDDQQGASGPIAPV